MSVETCSVVWDNDCDSPANLEPAEKARCTCYACGLPVCSHCSRRIKWHHLGRRRICLNCQPPGARPDGWGGWQ